MKHRHVWDKVIEGAVAELPKENTPEKVLVDGWAYGCKCGYWEFACADFHPVEVTPPPEYVFREVE